MRTTFFVQLVAVIAAPQVFAQYNTGNFTIVGGQVYTPGLAIVDAPQPFTPEGGDFLQVALDISGDGRLPFPTNPSTDPTQIHNITLFLYSYTTNFNFTISNGSTLTQYNSTPPLAPILEQEPSSTVKHVNWLWPSCLVGNGAPTAQELANGSARGEYNISIHQQFRLNGSEFYTIFDLPISVTNEIPDEPSSAADTNDPPPGPATNTGGRIACNLLENNLLSWDIVNASINSPSVQPYLGGSVVVSGSGSSSSSGNGLGSTTTTTTASASGATNTGSSTSGSGLGGSGSSSGNGLGNSAVFLAVPFGMSIFLAGLLVLVF